MNSDQWLATAIDGVLHRHLPAQPDPRGSFSELWRTSWTDPLTEEPFVQANLSRSKAGVLRGMHFHLVQTDLWVVIEGHAMVGLADLRRPVAGSAWRPPSGLLEIEAGDALLIPPRIAHGFYAKHELSLVYLVTREFDATDEHGFAWDDPMAGVPWPIRDPILSTRDRANPSLEDALQGLLGQPQSSGA